LHSAPFFVPDPFQRVSGPSSAGNRPKTNSNYNCGRLVIFRAVRMPTYVGQSSSMLTRDPCCFAPSTRRIDGWCGTLYTGRIWRVIWWRIKNAIPEFLWILFFIFGAGDHRFRESNPFPRKNTRGKVGGASSPTFSRGLSAVHLASPRFPSVFVGFSTGFRASLKRQIVIVMGPVAATHVAAT